MARLVSPIDDAEGADRRRTVFFVSDRTGITAEMLGNSLLSQFEAFDFQRRTIPFVDTPEKIAEVVRTIDATRASDGKRPLVFSSIVDEAMSAQLGKAKTAVVVGIVFQTLTEGRGDAAHPFMQDREVLLDLQDLPGRMFSEKSLHVRRKFAKKVADGIRTQGATKAAHRIPQAPIRSRVITILQRAAE